MTERDPKSHSRAPNAEAVEINRDFFDEQYQKFGVSSKALDMSSPVWQRRRFDVLIDLLGLPLHRPFSLLDVGCGFADLHEYLIERGYQPRYTGIDVTPAIVDKARELRGESVQLACLDYLDSEPLGRFDYVACSGALNMKVEDSWGWATSMVERMYRDADFALAFNITSRYTAKEYRQDRTYYADPAEMFGFCKGLCERVSLRHDYLPNDFAVGLHKQSFR